MGKKGHHVLSTKKGQHVLSNLLSFTHADLLLTFLIQVAYFFGCHLYLLTLEGGDVDHLKERAPWFVVLSIANCLIYAGVSMYVKW
jgi:hypothetical protein